MGSFCFQSKCSSLTQYQVDALKPTDLGQVMLSPGKLGFHVVRSKPDVVILVHDALTLTLDAWYAMLYGIRFAALTKTAVLSYRKATAFNMDVLVAVLVPSGIFWLIDRELQHA